MSHFRKSSLIVGSRGSYVTSFAFRAVCRFWPGNWKGARDECAGVRESVVKLNGMKIEGRQ